MWKFNEFKFKNINDKQIDIEILQIQKSFEEFRKKYANLKFLNNTLLLKKSIDDYNKLLLNISSDGIRYLDLLSALDSEDIKLQARYNKITESYIEYSKSILFYCISISKLDIKKQRQLLKDKNLKEYHYFLKTLFEEGKYVFNEREESLVTDKDISAHNSWVDLTNRLRNKIIINWQNKDISLNEAMAIKSNLPREERRLLHKLISENLLKLGDITEAELNAIIKNKYLEDKARGYKYPYERTILGYKNSIESIMSLVKTVQKDYKNSQRFYEIKRKVLNKIEEYPADDKLEMADVATPLRLNKNDKKYTYEEGVKIVKDAFEEVDKEFSDIFDYFIENDLIDVYPKKGKYGGAFCSHALKQKTRVLLNWANTENDIYTLAHEMGHAIHSELSKKQIPIYESYTISVAEVASNFFENILFDKIYEKSNKDTQKDMLFLKVQDNISSIHTQISFFQFELDLHNKVINDGYVSIDDIYKLYTQNRKKIVGDSMNIINDDGSAVTYISHFRSFFYVYTYAMGIIIANALYEMYKEDNSFIDKVKIFLSAGGSDTPDNIFKKIGVDITKEDFFKKGLKTLEKRIKALEKLA